MPTPPAAMVAGVSLQPSTCGSRPTAKRSAGLLACSPCKALANTAAALWSGPNRFAAAVSSAAQGIACRTASSKCAVQHLGAAVVGEFMAEPRLARV